MKCSPMFPLIALLGSLLLAACALHTGTATPPPPSPTPDVSPTTPPPDAKETVAEFYRWYITYPGDVVADGAYRDNEILRSYLADEFVERIDTLRRSFDKYGNYDPFLCSQGIPIRLEYTVEGAGEREARVRVSPYWGGSPQPYEVLVDLDRGDVRWQIVDTECEANAGDDAPTADSPPTQTIPLASPTPSLDWVTYHNDDYGFHIDYPANWTPVESFDNRLSEDDPVAGYVTFVQGAEARPTPVALVVITGPGDAFRLLFPDPEDDKQVLYVNGKIVTVERHFEREMYYFVRRPADETPRIAIRVIPRTSQADRELDNIVGLMLESLDLDD